MHYYVTTVIIRMIRKISLHGSRYGWINLALYRPSLAVLGVM